MIFLWFASRGRVYAIPASSHHSKATALELKATFLREGRSVEAVCVKIMLLQIFDGRSLRITCITYVSLGHF